MKNVKKLAKLLEEHGYKVITCDETKILKVAFYFGEIPQVWSYALPYDSIESVPVKMEVLCNRIVFCMLEALRDNMIIEIKPKKIIKPKKGKRND